MQTIHIDKINTKINDIRTQKKQINIVSLAKSIKKNGLLHPIVVSKSNDGYFLIAGHRRLEASKLNGDKKINASVIDSKNDLEIALIENMQREDLHPIDLAYAINKLKNRYGYTDLQLSRIIGKSRIWITSHLSLINLDETIQHLAIKQNFKSRDALIEISRLTEVKKQKELFNMVCEQNLSVKEIRKITRGKIRKLNIKTYRYRYHAQNKKFSIWITFKRGKPSRREILEAIKEVENHLKIAFGS